jgi:hypothetical protein
MSIKRSDKPSYRLQLPITKKRVEYTSFTMRSERTLMMATQSGDSDELTCAVINTLNDHIRTEGIKAEDLPQSETELLLLNMRAKSVGETIELSVKDPDPSYEGPEHQVKVDLTDVTVIVDSEFSDTIELKDGTVIKFNLPGLKTMEGIDFDENKEFDSTIDVFVKCVQSIVCGEEVYTHGETSEKEFRDFFLDLDSAEFRELSDTFFIRIPQLGIDLKIKRPDGSEVEVPIRGLASFL